MKKTPEEIKEEILEILNECIDFKVEGFDREKAVNKFSRYINDSNAQHHSDKLDEVAGELPSDAKIEKQIEECGLSKVPEGQQYWEGSEWMRSVASKLLVKHQQQAQEDAVGFDLWKAERYVWDGFVVIDGKKTLLYKCFRTMKYFNTQELYAIYKSKTT